MAHGCPEGDARGGAAPRALGKERGRREAGHRGRRRRPVRGGPGLGAAPDRVARAERRGAGAAPRGPRPRAARAGRRAHGLGAAGPGHGRGAERLPGRPRGPAARGPAGARRGAAVAAGARHHPAPDADAARAERVPAGPPPGRGAAAKHAPHGAGRPVEGHHRRGRPRAGGHHPAGRPRLRPHSRLPGPLGALGRLRLPAGRGRGHAAAAVPA
mmetsp:Transcript_1440/g.2837  ORF Transcript_1440/g.2837 Transcript_1440/m.2837 type:complete len:214 (-) Transcript_1440:699-1340(-)